MIGKNGGTSKPKHARRDDYRLRGLTLSAMPGTQGPWDRGHFVGHAIGGVVDGKNNRGQIPINLPTLLMEQSGSNFN